MSDVKTMDFFTDVDKNRKGENASEYPAWMFESHMDELRESIRQKEFALDNDLVAPSERMIQKDRLRQERAKIEAIEGSRPKIEGQELDRIVKVRKFLAEQIRSSMFTHTDMMRGTADAHEEARRMSEPVISIKHEDILPVLKACGVDSISPDGKISRNQAEKAWKIIGAYIGEPTNVEVLRKDK